MQKSDTRKNDLEKGSFELSASEKIASENGNLESECQKRECPKREGQGKTSKTAQTPRWVMQLPITAVTLYMFFAWLVNLGYCVLSMNIVSVSLRPIKYGFPLRWIVLGFSAMLIILALRNVFRQKDALMGAGFAVLSQFIMGCCKFWPVYYRYYDTKFASAGFHLDVSNVQWIWERGSYYLIIAVVFFALDFALSRVKLARHQ